jgi:hypothetical protein
MVMTCISCETLMAPHEALRARLSSSAAAGDRPQTLIERLSTPVDAYLAGNEFRFAGAQPGGRLVLVRSQSREKLLLLLEELGRR